MQLPAVINPLAYPGWDAPVLLSNASFFHSSYWARVLHETYGYEPVYFAERSDAGFSLLLPLMEIRSNLTGCRGVSLPFTDYCEPLLPANSNISEIMEDLILFGKKSGWKYLELRGANLPVEVQPSSSYYGHLLELLQDEDRLFSGFRNSTQRNIRKAQKEGVTVEISDSVEALKEFYRLNCITRKVHGLPPQPYMFFEKIHEHILSRGQGVIALAAFEGKTIAGSLNLHFGHKAIYKYGASDSRYQQLRANNLVMWEAIRWYAGRGFKEFCFGRTEPENEGLLQFKRGWGPRERSIKYYRFDLRQNAYVKEKQKIHGFHNKVFSRMPMPMLKLAGEMLYKHIG